MRPLVVMTPKSLLRLPQAASSLAELADGAFASVLDDPRFARARQRRAVKRVVLCSGKVYYDLLLSPEREAAADLAIIRVERLYPFPTEDLRPVLARYPGLEKLSWVQEEPRNMGARKFVMPKIRHLVPYKIPLGDVSRPERSRPAEGYPARTPRSRHGSFTRRSPRSRLSRRVPRPRFAPAPGGGAAGPGGSSPPRGPPARRPACPGRR